jgi:hypothetical protein
LNEELIIINLKGFKRTLQCNTEYFYSVALFLVQNNKSVHYKGVPKIYEDLLITTVSLDLNLYHDLDPRCPICFDETTGDNNHVEIKHPSCWCSPIGT